MKIIRLWGVISFFVLLLLIVAAWYLLAPSLIKNGLESVATEALGAKVEVDQVNLSLFPMGVEISRLQATDPNNPMQNIVEIGRIKFALDSDALLWKKIQIDELNISEIQLATNRQSSGELANGRMSAQLGNDVASIEIPELQQQDINSLVEQADLLTVKRLNELKESEARLEQEWQTALDSEANQQRVKALEQEFNRLKDRANKNKMNLLADRKDWKELNKAIDLERKTIKDLNQKFKSDKALLSQQVQAVRKGPKDDLEAIMGNMGLGNGIEGLSDKFLGPEFTPWIKRALGMVSGLKSEPGSSQEAMVYSTEQGLRVQFRDEQVFPDVLIKKVILSGKDEQWSLNGDGSNLGYFPWLVGQPAKLDLAMIGQGKANFSLSSDWKTAQQMTTQIKSKIEKWPLQEFQLMATNAGSWKVKSGQLNSDLNGELSLEKVDLNLSLNLSQPTISAPEQLSSWQKTLAQSLNQQTQLSININVSGSLEKPKFKISSSIEQLFKDAIGQKIKQQADKLKEKFSDAIAEKVGDLGNLEQYTQGLDQWSSKLKSNDELLEKLKVKL